MTASIPPEPPEKRKAPNILVYRIGQLGDTIVALPALWAVHRAFPEARLTYLSSHHTRSGYVSARLVLPSEGLIDEWLTYSMESAGRVISLIRLWRGLRRRRFDILVYLAPRLRRRFSVLRDLFFFRLAGIRHVVGHRGISPLPARRPGERLPAVEHEADHLLRRLELCGFPKTPIGRGDTDLALTSREREEGEQWLRLNVPANSAGLSLVGIGPGSKWPSKLWPEERFAELGTRLIRELGFYPVVFGGSDEAALAARLIKHWGAGVSAAGVLSIRAAATVLARCSLYVGNDTGTMHLAAAVGTPCVAIFSALDWPGRWHPYGHGHTVLRRQVPCEGCLLSVCTMQGMRCLREITTDDVIAHCHATLFRSGHSLAVVQ